MRHNITLVSNVLNNNFTSTSNTIAQFKTYLNPKLCLSGSHWFVGIKEILYTKSWYNITQTHKIILYNEAGEILNEFNPIYDNLHIIAGYYDTPKKLVDEINLQLRRIIDLRKIPIVHYNEINNLIHIECGLKDNLKVFPYFGEEIASLLGLKEKSNQYYYETGRNIDNIATTIINNDIMQNNDIIYAQYPVEITRGYHALFVYTNIVYPSRIGDTSSQFLQAVENPKKTKFSENYFRNYDRPQYKKVLYNEIDNIEISIKDDNAELIPFKFGRVLLTLTFKEIYKKDYERY